MIGKLFKRRAGVPVEQLRKARPIRNPHVTYESLDDGSVLIEAPLVSQGKGIMGAIAKRMQQPAIKKFDLEPIGAFVWEHCDGEHTFEGIARKLREKYKMNRLEAEAALGAFLQTLMRKRLVTMMEPHGK